MATAASQKELKMKIGVFGTGVVARAIGASLIDAGQEVIFGTRDVNQTLARAEPDRYGGPPFGEWKKQLPQAKLGTFSEAAGHGEILVNATAGAASLAALELAGQENLSGKTLVDIANPLDFSQGFPPTLTVCNTDSLAEQIQNAFPQAKVVKTLNTMNANVMVNPALVPGDHNVFLSGNDAGAKAQVRTMLTDWFGWKPENVIDLGGITTARGTEMVLPLWAQLFSVLQNPLINFHIAAGTPPG